MPGHKKKTPKKDTIKALSESVRQLKALSVASTRSMLASRLGQSYGGDRDIYEALGYKKTPDFSDYMARYKRQDIARAIVNAPVAQSWLKPPKITESETEDTAFEKAWRDMVDHWHIFHYMSRVDRLAGIGTYAVLVIGADDGKAFNESLDKAANLLYLTPVSMQGATIATYEKDQQSERFALPLEYQVKIDCPGATGISMRVHHSRIIHVAEDKLEDNIHGTPRLEAVLNRCQDLELIVGGSAEMFWRGGFPGIGFKADEGFNLQGQDITDLQDEIEEYMHGLKRYLRLKGVSVEKIDQQLADPTGNAGIEIDLIACATGIPKRILMGSERGELASSMDEKSWMATIGARQQQHCEPTILRPTIDRLISAGILPEPKDGYTVEWPDLMSASDKDVAEVGSARMKALKDYMDSGGDMILPAEIFLEKVFGFSGDEIEQIREILDKIDKTVRPNPDDGDDQ